MIYLFKTNVLRNSNTEIKGKLSLRSSYSNDFFNMPDKIFQEQEELEKKVLEAKEEYKRVIEETELKKQEILNEANENSKVIEKKAYELGYEQGLKNGYEDGYKESYEQNIEKAIKESEEIKQEGYNTLLNIKNEAKSYIKENKESIINISISIAEQVLREKFKDIKLMEAMLNNIIAEYDLKKDLVINLITNPMLIEHEEFSDMLMSILHLREELSSRCSHELEEYEIKHLAKDINVAYKYLTFEWIQYMKQLKSNYPQLFLKALITNPFDKRSLKEKECSYL